MLAYFLDTIKKRYPRVYLKFQLEPGKAIRSLFIACGFGFILSYFFRFPGSLLLQTALDDAPISSKLLVDALYVLVTPFIMRILFEVSFNFQTFLEYSSYLKRFQKSSSEEEKKNLVKLCVDPLIFSAEYEFSSSDDPLLLFGGDLAKENLLTFCRASVSLDDAIKKYAKMTVSIMLQGKSNYLLARINLLVHLNKIRENQFAKQCERYIMERYFPEQFQLLEYPQLAEYSQLEYSQRLLLCEKKINLLVKEHQSEVDEALEIGKKCNEIFAQFKGCGNQEDQKKYITEFANLLFISAEVFGKKLVEKLNHMSPFKPTSFSGEVSWDTLSWQFIQQNIDSKLSVFLLDTDQTQVEFIELVKQHINDHFVERSAFKACLKYYQAPDDFLEKNSCIFFSFGGSQHNASSSSQKMSEVSPAPEACEEEGAGLVPK